MHLQLADVFARIVSKVEIDHGIRPPIWLSGVVKAVRVGLHVWVYFTSHWVIKGSAPALPVYVCVLCVDDDYYVFFS